MSLRRVELVSVIEEANWPNRILNQTNFVRFPHAEFIQWESSLEHLTIKNLKIESVFF
jgi:hypothetical protein